MAVEYNSAFTGLQVDDGVRKAIPLDQLTATDVTISSVTYHTLWKVAPTSSNQVYGFAIHPTEGRLYRIYNNKGSYSAQAYDKDTTTDTKVTQTASTDNLELPLLLKNVAATTTVTDTSRFSADIKINPSTKTLTAPNIINNNIDTSYADIDSLKAGNVVVTGGLTVAGNISGNLSGNATSANKLNTNAGSGTQPVYFSNGIPVATTYSLGKSVPSDAKFTDTVYTHPAGSKPSVAAGFYKIGTDATSHVATLTAVTKADITALGIPGSDTQPNNAYISLQVAGVEKTKFYANDATNRTFNVTAADLHVAGAYVHQGSCTWAQLIAKTNQSVGWVWNITDKDPTGNTGQNWACKQAVGSTAPGSSYADYWDAIGGIVDLSNYFVLNGANTVSGNNTFTGTNTFGTIKPTTISGGILTTTGNYYYTNGQYGINMANSDIIGANSIYTADTADNTAEGIRFYRDSSHWDSLTANGGNLYFMPNDTLAGTSFSSAGKIWHSLNDGASSGLDADLLDGYHASSFATSGHTHTSFDSLNIGNINVTGSASFTNTINGSISGNAATATTASKLGTTTVGSTTQPVYINAGTATAGSTYAGGTAVTLNGNSKAASTASFYAPTSAGTSGQLLVSTGGAPSWKTVTDFGYVVGPSSSTDNAIARFDGATGKVLQNSIVTIADNGKMTFNTSAVADMLDLGNNNITNVNAFAFADPGPSEGISWGGSTWCIWDCPNDLTTNSDGNIQFVHASSRMMTVNTSGQVEIPVATGTAPLKITSTTAVANLNADLLDGKHSTNFIWATNANGYYGLTTPAGSTTDYIRTTSNGIIPYQSGGASAGHGYIGTSSWFFSAAYIQNLYGTTIYENSIALSNKYAALADVTVEATANKIAKRNATGGINAVAVNICTVGTSTTKASMQYNTTDDCIEFVFA